MRRRTVKAVADLGSTPAARAHPLGQGGEMDRTELGGSAREVEAGGQRALVVREARPLSAEAPHRPGAPSMLPEPVASTFSGWLTFPKRACHGRGQAQPLPLGAGLLQPPPLSSDRQRAPGRRGGRGTAPCAKGVKPGSKSPSGGQSCEPVSPHPPSAPDIALSC